MNGRFFGKISFLFFWFLALAGIVLVREEPQQVGNIVFYAAWVVTVIWGAVAGKSVRDTISQKYNNPAGAAEKKLQEAENDKP
jgi:hypothetical protein